MMRAFAVLILITLAAAYLAVGCTVLVINGNTQVTGPTGHPFCLFNCANDSSPKNRQPVKDAKP